MKKNVLRYVIFAAVGVVSMFCSCGGKDVGEDPRFFAPDKFKVVNSAPDTTKVLKLEKLPIEVFGPKMIAVKDSLLVVATNDRTAYGTVVNLNTYQNILRFAPNGRGPNDFGGLWLMNHFFYNDNGDLILDAKSGNKLKSVNLTKSIREQGTFLYESIASDKLYKHPDYFGNTYPVTLGKDRYFILQDISYRDARENKYFPPKYILKEPEGQYEFSPFPECVTSQYERNVPYSVYNSKLRIRPDLKKVVEVMSTMECINIIDIKSKKILAVIDEQGRRFMDFYQTEDLMSLARGGLYDADVSDKYIVALHNDLSILDTYSSPDKLWPAIKIYDWEGNFIAGAKLPKGARINQIAFDGEKNIAYFFDAEEQFYRCDLSELLK